MERERMEELTPEACWEVLAEQQIGRLAYVLDGEVNIVPINHAVREGQIIFETGQGSKLVALDEQGTVAYEVDRIDEHESVSVVVRGFATELEGEEARTAASGVHPWIEGDKPDVMVIVPSVVTGRVYRFDRP
ncbi:pyridoxamine 5'-phosphate oxidase family protein [Raineyella fluvialis]|uniref:Pyridoxamine 5'-phosphate oxidase family protein n=1 Tax=Raineyella fluvialis TaxID=2662261 RepID=A0A5Q2FJC7_9ACTN|nr:pyridoxamine 5'-phosphate oxidase family protein [Raineyella fluvialis]QGF24406.1 pyridoxamine 5'-phosphate oxidase family protein [Raineyella fluvialis]